MSAPWELYIPLLQALPALQPHFEAMGASFSSFLSFSAPVEQPQVALLRLPVGLLAIISLLIFFSKLMTAKRYLPRQDLPFWEFFPSFLKLFLFCLKLPLLIRSAQDLHWPDILISPLCPQFFCFPLVSLASWVVASQPAFTTMGIFLIFTSPLLISCVAPSLSESYGVFSLSWERSHFTLLPLNFKKIQPWATL